MSEKYNLEIEVIKVSESVSIDLKELEHYLKMIFPASIRLKSIKKTD